MRRVRATGLKWSWIKPIYESVGDEVWMNTWFSSINILSLQKMIPVEVLCGWPVLPDGEQDLVSRWLHGTDHLCLPSRQPSQVRGFSVFRTIFASLPANPHRSGGVPCSVFHVPCSGSLGSVTFWACLIRIRIQFFEEEKKLHICSIVELLVIIKDWCYCMYLGSLNSKNNLENVDYFVIM